MLHTTLAQRSRCLTCLYSMFRSMFTMLTAATSCSSKNAVGPDAYFGFQANPLSVSS